MNVGHKLRRIADENVASAKLNKQRAEENLRLAMRLRAAVGHHLGASKGNKTKAKQKS